MEHWLNQGITGHSRWIELAWLSIAVSLAARPKGRALGPSARHFVRTSKACTQLDFCWQVRHPLRSRTQAPAVAFFRLRGISATNSSPACDCITIVALAEMHAFKGT